MTDLALKFHNAKIRLTGFIALSLLISLTACSTTSSNKTIESTSELDLILLLSGETYADETATPLELLYQQHRIWHGTPYRLGGTSRNGIDCSAFVQRTYRDVYDISLPRTTDQQLRVGKKIAKSDLQAGDLVFFRRGDHVGIYLEDNKFLHASTRVGVTISSMNNVYWSRKYWRSIRVQSRHNDH